MGKHDLPADGVIYVVARLGSGWDHREGSLRVGDEVVYANSYTFDFLARDFAVESFEVRRVSDRKSFTIARGPVHGALLKPKEGD